MIKKDLINQKKFNPKELENIMPQEKAKDDLYDDCHFVFVTVCGDPVGPGSYFEEIVQSRLNVPPQKQHEGLIVEENTLFQLVIDFCRYFNKKFKSYGKSSLDFPIGWFEDMRKNPQLHEEEWNIWEKTIQYVDSPGDKHLIF
ncbi:MAG: hypothetical protein H7A38_06550 [Chlamydiales bacterium]|nr:hypothetical protein [Chlamydiales bacterium]